MAAHRAFAAADRSRTGWPIRAGIPCQEQQTCAKGPKTRLIGLISLHSESEETQWLPR